MIIPIRVKKIPKREFHPFVPPSPKPEPVEGYTMAIFSDDLPALLAEYHEDGEEMDFMDQFSCDGVDYVGISISGPAPHNMYYVLSWKEPEEGGGPDEAVQVTDDGAFVDQKYKYVLVEDGEALEYFVMDLDDFINEGLVDFDPPLPEPETVVSIGLNSELDFTGMSDKTWTIGVYKTQSIQ
jgi:hypothetical protein